MNRAGLDSKDIRIIRNLYWGQTASVKINDTASKKIKIKKGVRQGCVLSTLLFNIFAEEIFKEALETAFEGIKLNDELINNIRYADDTVILANDTEELQRLLQNFKKSAKNLGEN